MLLNRLLGVFALSVATLGFARTANAQRLLLQNDGFASTDLAAFSTGFVATEIAAARLVPSSGTYRLLNVTCLFGGATTTHTVTLRVWDDVGTAAPGGPLYTGDFEITGSDAGMSEFDLSFEDILVSGPFRVGLEFQHAGLPSIAADSDGTIVEANNFIMAGTAWSRSSALGLSGDWILRATVEREAGSGGEGGAGGAPMSAGQGGVGDSAGASGESDGGGQGGAPTGDAGATGEGGTVGAEAGVGGANGEGGAGLSSGGAGAAAGEGGAPSGVGGAGNAGSATGGSSGRGGSGGSGATGGGIVGAAGEAGSDASGGGSAAPKSDSGCGCHVPASGSSRAGFAWVLAVLALTRRRGRRSARSKS
jgi:hypothetical protein